MKALSVKEMKAAEMAAVNQGISLVQLMENAGTACARAIVEKHPVLNRNVTILVGNGNNGGDGLVIARQLDQRGADVKIVFCKGLPKADEAKVMYPRIPVSVQKIMANENLLAGINAIDSADILIDCIFGTGFHGEPDELLGRIFELANRRRIPRISVDIPSGINGDTGEHGKSWFRPTETLALGAYKLAHLPEKAGNLCGELQLLDIGIDKETIDDLVPDLICADADYVHSLLPLRDPNSHKGTYGRLLILAGSVGMGGAALIVTKAALRSGSGITVLASARSVVQPAFPQIMEAITVPLPQTEYGAVSIRALPVLREQVQKASAVVIGCGLGQDPETVDLLLEWIPEIEVPLLLDADALNSLKGHLDLLKKRKAPTVLTPHPGELARLLDLSVSEVVHNAAKAARFTAMNYSSVVVLKGHRTLTSNLQGVLYENTTGNAGMAKGGSGDALSGIIGALLAQHFDPADAAVLGVYLHGLAGDLCAEKMSQYSICTGDLIEALPKAFLQTEQQPVSSEAQREAETVAMTTNQKVLDIIHRM